MGILNKFDSTKSMEHVTDVSKYDNAGKWSMDIYIAQLS